MNGQPAAFKAALIQMRTGLTPAVNVDNATRMIREAKAAGADYVQTPEMTNIMDVNRERFFATIQEEDADKSLAAFRALARELGIFIHVGSLAIKVAPEKAANRGFLISPKGDIATRYDKIHMFDVDLPNGETYRESTNYAPGAHAVVADLPWGPIGFSICYDLRFPYLYRALAHAGARFLAIPAAFTRVTGEAHWITLLRARAIECQCYVFAAAQGGRHEHGRETFGHSAIISPWGQVLAEGGIHPSVIYADVELGMIEDVRTRVPSLRHDREFDVIRPGSEAAAKVTP